MWQQKCYIVYVNLSQGYVLFCCDQAIHYQNTLHTECVKMCDPMPVPNTMTDDIYDLVGCWGLTKLIECPCGGYAIEVVSSQHVSIV